MVFIDERRGGSGSGSGRPSGSRLIAMYSFSMWCLLTSGSGSGAVAARKRRFFHRFLAASGNRSIAPWGIQAAAAAAPPSGFPKFQLVLTVFSSVLSL